MAKLQIIDPIAVLTAKVSAPDFPEKNDTVVSGKVVAIATMVAPTTTGGIFVLLANHTEDSTSISPPFKISTKAKTKTIIQIKSFI